jgi:hypothetical protein
MKLNQSLARAQGRHLRITEPKHPIAITNAESFSLSSCEPIRKAS